MENWGGVSAAYRASFAQLCAGTHERLLAELPVGRMLDVGCGPGELLALALASGRDAVGVDADPGMAALAGAVAPGRVACAALPSLPFGDDAFASVVANFVVNHLPDPRAGVRELARVLAPAGRLAMTIWPAGGAGWGPLLAEAFEAGGVVALPPSRLPAHLDFERSADGLAAVADQAGLRVLDAGDLTWTWRVTPQALWTGVAGGVATPGETFLAQAPEVQERTRLEFARRTRDAPGGVLAFACRAIRVLATR